ncbi:hypothetical protein ACFXA9_36550, partial [Streptomyces sp. NPDC059411]
LSLSRHRARAPPDPEITARAPLQGFGATAEQEAREGSIAFEAASEAASGAASGKGRAKAVAPVTGTALDVDGSLDVLRAAKPPGAPGPREPREVGRARAPAPPP